MKLRQQQAGDACNWHEPYSLRAEFCPYPLPPPRLEVITKTIMKSIAQKVSQRAKVSSFLIVKRDVVRCNR